MKFNSSLNNVFSLGVLQIFNYILPLFSLPYLFITLGAKANGYLITSQTMVSYFVLLIDYGFVLTASKKVALIKQREETEKVFSSVFISKCILFVVALVLVLLASLFFQNKTILICIYIGFFQVVGLLFNPVWLFQGTENANMLAKINIYVRTFFYVLIFILVHSSKDLYLAVFLLSFPHFVVGILCYMKAKKVFNIRIVRISYNEILNELKEGFYGFWVTVMNFTYTASGILLIGMFSTQEIVGIYGTLEKLIRAGIQVFNPIIHGLYPKVLNLINENKTKQFKKILFACFSFSALSGVLLFLLSPIISKIILGGISNTFSINILKLLSIWFVFNTINVVTGIWIFFSRNKMKSYTTIYTTATIVCVVLQLFLIPLLGPTAVPINLIVGEIIVSLLIYSLLKRGKV